MGWTWLLFAALLLGGAILQPVWGIIIPLDAWRPNPYLTVAVLWGIRYGYARGMVAGLLGGAMESALTALNPGAYVVSRALAAEAAGAVRDLVMQPRIWLVLLTVMGATAVARIVFYVVSPIGGFDDAMADGFAEAFANAVLSAPIWHVICKIDKKGGGSWSRL